jgi:hypothetical protein
MLQSIPSSWTLFALPHATGEAELEQPLRLCLGPPLRRLITDFATSLMAGVRASALAAEPLSPDPTKARQREGSFLA